MSVAEPPDQRLLRIQEVSDEVGLTARSIRYYEEIGLLKPAARSEGSYRLYDADDIERLRLIKALRDDAGFSLFEIGEVLEDETRRAKNRERFWTSRDADERKTILLDLMAIADRQIDKLDTKISRLTAMVEEARARRRRHDELMVEILAGREPERRR